MIETRADEQPRDSETDTCDADEAASMAESDGSLEMCIDDDGHEITYRELKHRLIIPGQAQKRLEARIEARRKAAALAQRPRTPDRGKERVGRFRGGSGQPRMTEMRSPELKIAIPERETTQRRDESEDSDFSPWRPGEHAGFEDYKLPPVRTGDYKLSMKSSYKVLRDKHDPEHSVRIPESFLIAGVLPPQCTKQSQVNKNMSADKLECLFHAFEMYRLFRKSVLAVDDSTDEFERKRFRDRPTGADIEAFDSWTRDLKSKSEGHASLITNPRRFKALESPTSIPPDSPSTPEIGREERIQERASRGDGTVKELERDRKRLDDEIAQADLEELQRQKEAADHQEVSPRSASQISDGDSASTSDERNTSG